MSAVANRTVRARVAGNDELSREQRDDRSGSGRAESQTPARWWLVAAGRVGRLVRGRGGDRWMLGDGGAGRGDHVLGEGTAIAGSEWVRRDVRVGARLGRGRVRLALRQRDGKSRSSPSTRRSAAQVPARSRSIRSQSPDRSRTRGPSRPVVTTSEATAPATRAGLAQSRPSRAASGRRRSRW